MQKALQQAILQDTLKNNNKNRKIKPKKDTKTITSGDIFSARTLESRFVLTHYDERTANPNTVISINRNLLRRGRASFPKKHNNKYGKNKKKKEKPKQYLNKEKKRLLRYQKRKPFYLLQEKTKNVNSGWLNTHLWHAKRCKMQLLWGYKLALRNLQHSAKSFRNSVNQLINVCTLHDASYWNIIALQGSQNKIMNILLPFIAPFQRRNDLFNGNKEVINGNKECELYFYKNNCYPFDFLCTVKCSWNAIQKNEDKNEDMDRVCWLWCHASVYKALFKLLECSIKKESNNDIEIRNESRKFVRYELRGPMSGLVLQAASQCFIPNLMEEKSDEFVEDGSIMCAQLICDPNHYSVAQPFILNKKLKKNKSKCKSLNFQLKQDFILCNTPSQHPLIIINQYKNDNYKMNGYFHTYFRELKTKENNSKKKKKKVRNVLFEFPFMMIAKRFYDNKNMKKLSMRNKIIGWDIIIPIHSTNVKSFIINEASINFTSIARFWWKNLHFGGGRVIGYEEKLFMRLEMKLNKLLFPIDYIDSMASIHYWLRYYKYEILKEYFNKPKSKRINPYPLYPYSFWPNILLLLLFQNQNENKMKNMQLSHDVINKNLLKCNHIKMDIDKESEYLLNYTLWGFKKNNCDLINNIKIKLKYDTIKCFDINWNQNENYKYFIIRDKNMLKNIKNCMRLKEKIDFISLYNWNESIVNCAFVLVNIQMCEKGVPTIGNPIFLNHKLFGYVIYGGYSSIYGCGIGIGIVKLNQILYMNNHDKIIISPFRNYTQQTYQCEIQFIHY